MRGGARSSAPGSARPRAPWRHRRAPRAGGPRRRRSSERDTRMLRASSGCRHVLLLAVRGASLLLGFPMEQSDVVGDALGRGAHPQTLTDLDIVGEIPTGNENVVL